MLLKLMFQILRKSWNYWDKEILEEQQKLLMLIKQVVDHMLYYKYI